jgi:hypothetical protein
LYKKGHNKILLRFFVFLQRVLTSLRPKSWSAENILRCLVFAYNLKSYSTKYSMTKRQRDKPDAGRQKWSGKKTCFEKLDNHSGGLEASPEMEFLKNIFSRGFCA